jgi:hypothetical protein
VVRACLDDIKASGQPGFMVGRGVDERCDRFAIVSLRRILKFCEEGDRAGEIRLVAGVWDGIVLAITGPVSVIRVLSRDTVTAQA